MTGNPWPITIVVAKMPSILPSLQGAKVGVLDSVEANKEESKASPMQAKYEAVLSAASNTSKQGSQLISVQGLLVMAVYMLATFICDQKPERR